MKRSLGAVRLRRWRDAHELTQMEAASRVGIDLFHFSKIERGAKNPGRTLSVKIRDLTGIDPGEWDMPATGRAARETEARE